MRTVQLFFTFIPKGTKDHHLIYIIRQIYEQLELNEM